MKLLVCLSLLLLIDVEASLRGNQYDVGASNTPCTGRGCLLPPSSPQIQEPVSLRTIQQSVAVLQSTLNTVLETVTNSRRSVDQTGQAVDQLLKHFLKRSCADIAAEAAIAPDPFLSHAVVGSTQSATNNGLSSTRHRSPSGSPGVNTSRQSSTVETGVYSIYPPDRRTTKVRCDVSSAGDAGWTVMLLRQDGSVLFNRTFEDYTQGFGDLMGEHWLGLDTIHALTSAAPHQLRVELKKFTGETSYALYNHFSIGDRNSNYKLSVGGYLSGSTAGDAFKDHNNMLFTTIDHDKDDKRDMNCASQLGGGGGWWYASCYHALGTGLYRSSRAAPSYGGVTWYPFTDVRHSLKEFKMLIKPLNG